MHWDNVSNLAGACKRQRGSASLYAIVVGMSITLASTAIMLYVQTDQLDAQEAVYFAEVKDKAIDCIDRILPMQNWFYSSLELGQNHDAQIAGLCGLPTKKAIRYELSNLIARENISYRVLSYWIGPYSKVDATVFNRATGVLTLDPVAVNGATVSSFQLDKEKVAKTNQLLRQIAHNHQLRFNTMYNTSGDAGYNFFRASNCSDVTEGEIPCSDSALGGAGGWRDINFISNATIFANVSNYSNIWGMPITYCNSPECGASIITPYSILFSTTTPWGVILSVSAIQNI